MPADRTSFSPVPSTSSAQRDKAASVARGLACLACRKRKVKCDSTKPVCGGCSRYAKGDNSTVSCVYDDVTAPKKKRSSPGTVAALEASNQALQAELEELKEHIAQMQSSANNGALKNDLLCTEIEGSSLRFPFGPTATGSIEGITFSRQYGASSTTASNSPRDFPLGSAPSPCAVPRDPRGSAYSGSLAFDDAVGGTNNGGGTFLGSTLLGGLGPTLPESPTADFWNQLMYPGWPKDLPSFELTSRLLDVWFSKPHCLTGLIHPGEFRASLLNPPTTSKFPHSALIHSMMAIASMLVSDDFFANEPRYWPLDQKVSEYHAARGKIALDQAIAHGQRLLQVSQAVTILCYWSYTSARFVELWLLCGMSTRIMTPLGLNQLAAPQDPNRFKMHLIPPPKDDAELHERSINCWYAFMSDRMATACTGWAHSIDEADIVSLLPTNAPSALCGDYDTSPLSPRSSSFFLAHPPHLVGPKQLELKAIILLGRVNTFVQRAPLASQRDQNGYSTTVPDIRKSDAFRKLENDIIGFQASIPREYSSSGAATVDPCLHIVHSLPPAVMVLLHERFVTSEQDDASAPITLRYAQQVMQVLHSVVSTSFEIGLLSPFMNYVWVVAGRNLVREIAFRMMRNQSGIDQLRSDVQTILLALHACKTPLATSTAMQLQTLLDDPYRALPSSSLFSSCPASAMNQAAARNSSKGGGRGLEDPVELLRTTVSTYPGSDFASIDTPSSSSSSYKPFTPPLSNASPHSSLSLSTAAAASNAENEKTLREIDDTLQNGFFGNLGDNSFGPELEALIQGSRASAPWMVSGNSVPPAASMTSIPGATISNSRAEGLFPLSPGNISMSTGRFEELDNRGLIGMESLSSIFGTADR